MLAGAIALDAGPPEVAAALMRLARLHEGRPALAVRTASMLGSRLADAEGETGPLLPVIGVLAEDGGHASGLFAVAVAEALGERTDWSPAWRKRLMSLRGHGVPDVRDAALAVCTSYE